MLDAIRAPLNVHAHIHACTPACVHIPGETLKCAAERANTHACPSRVEEVDTIPLASPLLSFSFPHFCLPARSPLAHSTRVRTLRDVRVCQWNTLSLSGGRQKGGREREGGIGGGTVPGNSGSRSWCWWWRTARSVVTRGTLALHGGL